MPIRLRISLAVAALALAACGYKTTPDVLVSPSPSPVPTGTTTTVTVRYQGNLLYNQPVKLYTNGGTTTSPQTGTLITTVNTDPSSLPTGGQAFFTGLTPGTIYCWTYDYAIPAPPGNAHAQVCTSSWQTGFTLGS